LATPRGQELVLDAAIERGVLDRLPFAQNGKLEIVAHSPGRTIQIMQF
jgi:hypothetical protein